MFSNVILLLRISLATLIGTAQFTATASQSQNELSLFNTKSIPLSETSTIGFAEGSSDMSTQLRHLRYLLSEDNLFTLLPINRANPDAQLQVSKVSIGDTVGQFGPDTNSEHFDNSQARALNNQSVIYLHTDMLGSVIAESDLNGNVIKRTEYKPFGESSGGD